MYHLIRLTNTSSSVQTSKRPECFRSFSLIALVLCCFALAPAPEAFGVTPAPDGGYPGNNTAEGQNALQSLTSGIWNTALGSQALFNNTAGNYNTATGFRALYLNTTGSYNTAQGSQALYSNTTGVNNTANGSAALTFNTTGHDNLANGALALFRNTTGSSNVATGSQALYNNTAGNENTATGYKALYANTTGSHNAATGYQALLNNVTGNYNMANGYQALYSNTTGYQNTANGIQALFRNTTGFDNTAYGFTALAFNITGTTNTAVGFNALFNNTGSGNTALGQSAGFFLTTGGNNIDIGNQGTAGESDTIRIGNEGTQMATFIAGIDTATVSGTAVVVDSNGQLGVATSSQRFKEQIEPMDKTSEAVLGLRPVTFRYRHEIDPKGIPQFGLVAEEVAKVNPDLVARDAHGKPYTVRYEAVNAMLLNEFLKQHRIVQEQQMEIKALAAQLKEQAALLQKVSNRLELSKPALPMAVNNQ